MLDAITGEHEPGGEDEAVGETSAALNPAEAPRKEGQHFSIEAFWPMEEALFQKLTARAASTIHRAEADEIIEPKDEGEN